MAWRLYRLGEFDGAADWFAKALAWTGGEVPPRSLAEGYVLALQGAKKFDAAQAAAAKWRPVSPEFDRLYVRSELQRLRATGKAGEIAPETLASFEATMADARAPDGALALAWLAYDAHDFPRALTWFRSAEQWSDEEAAPKAKEGVALSLRALERYEDLADYGYAQRKVSPALHDAYFGGMVAWLTADKPLLAVKPQARDDFELAVNEERSVLGAQALAWGALARNDLAPARKWFETAMDWSGFDPLAPQGAPDEARAKLVEGYVQTLRAGGDLERAEDVAFLWRDAGAALGGLYLQIFTQELSLNDSDLGAERMARFAAAAEAKRSPQAAGALGWRAYRGKAFDDAVGWFIKAISWSPGQSGDAKLNEGYALSLRASGQSAEAESFAWAHRDQSRELRAAYVAAFSDQLLDPKLSPKLSPCGSPGLARSSRPTE